MPRNSRKSGIAKWPESERPRERLLLRGANALSDAELLAILLRLGVRGKSAVELGRELLKRFGSLQGMMSAPIAAWSGMKGLGMAKITQLQAALELGRRAALPVADNKVVIKSTAQASAYFSARLRGLPEEHFRVAYLNRRGKVLGDILAAHGTTDIVRPPVRSVVADALRLNASALIAAHNHPSGTAEPSESDRTLTRDLLAACNPIGIKVLDHVIVTDACSYSFADSGLLDQLNLETLAPGSAKNEES